MSAERSTPRPTEGGFADSLAISGALDEVTSISRMRGRAHAEANLFRDLHVDAVESAGHDLRHQLSSAQTVMARWALVVAHQEFRTVDLARVENNGDWDATREAEAGIGELGLQLFMDEEAEGLVERDTPEAKLRISIDPTIVSSSGLLAVRRKRLMIATRPAPVDFVDIRPKVYVDGKRLAEPRVDRLTADVHMEVDKVSEFVLDIAHMRDVDAHAAAELRELAERGVALEVTAHRKARAAHAIEAAINKRHPSLMPAVTTYYADRKYRNIRDTDPVLEVVDV